MIKSSILFLSLFFALPVMAQKYVQADDCRDRIKQIVCLVDQPPSQGFLKRTCLPNSEPYQTVFENHWDRSPNVIKNMYCHLGKIFIESKFVGTAYASIISDNQGRVTAGAIGIRKEVLDNPTTYPQWLSWKEETSFGGSTSITGPSLNLIHYNSNLDRPENFLDFVIAHEFGHLFDMTNSLNNLDDCSWDEEERPVGSCTPTPGSWTALSWQGPENPLPLHDYSLRKETCFYFCNGKFLAPQDSSTIFTGLLGSNFPSTYAATNYADDWAETFAYHMMIQSQGFQLSVETHGNIFDLTKHFSSELLASKRSYVEAFLRSPYLYPGEEPTHIRSQRMIIDR